MRKPPAGRTRQVASNQFSRLFFQGMQNLPKPLMEERNVFILFSCYILLFLRFYAAPFLSLQFIGPFCFNMVMIAILYVRNSNFIFMICNKSNSNNTLSFTIILTSIFNSEKEESHRISKRYFYQKKQTYCPDVPGRLVTTIPLLCSHLLQSCSLRTPECEIPACKSLFPAPRKQILHKIHQRIHSIFKVRWYINCLCKHNAAMIRPQESRPSENESTRYHITTPKQETSL